MSHKKGAGKKVKKLGNNQYTKLREQGIAPSSPHSKKRQLARDTHGTLSSGDEQPPPTNGETHTSNSTSKNSPDHPNGGANGKAVGGGGGKFAKGRKNGVHGPHGAHGSHHRAGAGAENGGERTLVGMSRSIEAMARSIAAAQLEMAGSWTPSAAGPGQRGGAVRPTSEPVGGFGLDGAGERVKGLGEDGKVPEGLSAMEMADLVSRGIHEWQRRFAHLV